VVSGVGFLGAGVIIPDGVSVRGINTAANLSCAAAVGGLGASGFIWQAGVATGAVLAINIVLRPLGQRIGRKPLDEDTEVETSYRFRATPATRAKRTSEPPCCRASPDTATSYTPSRAPTSTAPTSSKSKPSSPPSDATTNKSKPPPAGSDSSPTSPPSAGTP
jgi:hypothetical protein